MRFKTITFSDGYQRDCYLADLTRIVYANCEILLHKEPGLQAIGFVSHQTMVFFAVEFADYAIRNYTKNATPQAQTCLDLTRKWLENQSSVSKEQLKNAALAAVCKPDPQLHHEVHHESHDFKTDTNCTLAAGYAAYAIYDAAYCQYAGHYATAAAGRSRAKEQKRQATFILNFFGAE